MVHTKLDLKHVTPVVGFDEHDLVLMREVERSLLVLLDRYVERCLPTLDYWN